MKDGIRLYYSGAIVFGAKILSALTGLAFALIVTRNLAVAEFGAWQYLSALFSYFAFPASLFPFWATRLYARGHDVGGMALLGNIALSMPFALAFLISAGLAAGIIEIDRVYFYILCPQFPLYYAAVMLDALAIGRRPQLVGYGIVVFELAKVALALLTFWALRLGLTGAILSVLGAYAAQATLMALMQASALSGRANLGLLRTLCARAWLPLLMNLPYYISTFDVLALALVSRSAEALALHKVAYSVAMFGIHTAYLSIGLYPKLLAGGGGVDVERAIRLSLMLSIPASIGLFALAGPILRIFRPEYGAAAPLLMIMAPLAVSASLNNIWGAVIAGSEMVDVDLNASSRALLRSRLMVWPALWLARGILLITLVAVLAGLLPGRIQWSHALSAALGCSLANLIADTSVVVVGYRMAKGSLRFSFPWRAVAKYLLASIPMGICVWLLDPKRALDALMAIALGTAIYSAELLAIDEEFREFLLKMYTKIHTIIM
ncbi:MAG: hypothetical protein QXJ15_05965 [Candidatus Bathyarchaeia archaeon]